ncbi:8-amino-7-oxononanoate synthase [Flavobacterium akiainvivens]|uniref:8-amino-7-oxononanoate synthase n=1 Tax=Flavobacterium akiainvivens TaxID=1202724 RepID=A0A0M8MEM6_9FLAO|nr:aminotransferase class I/II-fold pyridoxal phosphate-dependent enzyme [Flavobacterium akiainvivens]KOS07284.1 8-amino-7-oxononanoate synthase [Flavobacterium akiainvivens]SFQ46185.1 8-amino-7-oxononanoate synthase [Flavobacterium akiainvivens]
MQQLPPHLLEKLEERKAANALLETRASNSLVDFSSSDYLGMAASTALFEAANQYLLDKNITANGATGTRISTGNYSLYDEAEAMLATFHKTESALIFNSRYDANLGFFSSVPQKGDVIVYDEQVHASIRDGIRLSGAASFKFPHNDVKALYKLVEKHRSKAAELYIVTESVFYIDGDCPNLLGMAGVARRYKCRLVVDEAHAVGVFGEQGEGLALTHLQPDEIFAKIVTFGKALGCHGAAVLGSNGLRSYLVNFARSFIYTTALPPHALATIICAYKMLWEDEENRTALHNTIMHFKWETERLKLTSFILSFSGIHSIVIPGSGNAKKIAAVLQRDGYDVRPILPPAVPEGQERLRFCVHTFNTRSHITHVLEILRATLFSLKLV